MRIRRRPRRAVSAARRRFDWRDDRGVSSSIEQLFAFVFLLMLFLFFMQVIVWWHAKNILEQSAAEGEDQDQRLRDGEDLEIGRAHV